MSRTMGRWPLSSTEQQDRRRAEFDAEFERARRGHRRFMFFCVLPTVATFALLTLTGLIGLVWWVWTGQHPFGLR